MTLPQHLIKDDPDFEKEISIFGTRYIKKPGGKWLEIGSDGRAYPPENDYGSWVELVSNLMSEIDNLRSQISEYGWKESQ